MKKNLLQTAADIVKKAKEKKGGGDLLLPADLICTERFDPSARMKDCLLDQIPDDWIALDIGPGTAKGYAKAVEDAGTIVWNGPMGVFEMEKFM